MQSVRTQFSPFSFPLLAFFFSVSFLSSPLEIFFLSVVSLNSMSLNTSFMTATLMFLPSSFRLQTHISYFLPDLSSWISNRIEFKLAKTELSISHLQICSLSHCPVFPFFFLFNGTAIHSFDQISDAEIISFPSISDESANLVNPVSEIYLLLTPLLWSQFKSPSFLTWIIARTS